MRAEGPRPNSTEGIDRLVGRILVTGGAGFIGSHTCVELLGHGHDIVVVDDFSNSSPAVVATSPGWPAARSPTTSWTCATALRWSVFSSHDIEAIIHFAARKAPRESVEMPVEYYTTNLVTTMNLLAAMQKFDVGRMVFSSSCSIYGKTEVVPIEEETPANPTNPYARTKLICEEMLADACVRFPTWSVSALRYFNPTGAHESGDLGEDPHGIPVNVMPYIAQVAVGRLARLEIYGGDYPTADGSGVRDYVHVMDLADAHRVALDRLDQPRASAATTSARG